MYYNPETKDYLSQGRIRARFGSIDKDRLLSMGYYPLVDPFANKTQSTDAFLEKSGIQIHENVAIQTYSLTNDAVEKLSHVKHKLSNIVDAINDTEAQLYGVEIGGLYHNNGEVRIRMV